MTPAEKLDLARRSYAAFSRGPDADALVAIYHADCEWRMGHFASAISTFHGHAGLRDFAGELAETFAEFRVEIDEARITEDGRFLLAGHASGRSASAGIDVQMPVWQEGEFRDGLILSIVQTDGAPAGWDTAEAIG